tara:strand:- start:7583 stop:8230 length:648 start_codon:yes stop_codon:yes gene_type:complete
MSLTARDSGGGSFTPVAPGMHLARCYRIVDMGTQKTEFQGQTKHLQKVMLQFEVHGEDDNGKPLVTAKGEPMSISKNFTLSLAEKATMRKDLQAWRGREFTPEELRGFELKNVLGAWAMITASKAVGNNGKEYTNIVSINPVPAAIKKAGMPEGFNKLAMFVISNPDMELFETFGNGLKEKITSSPEWRAQGPAPQPAPDRPSSGFDDMDDDIPF